jgi:hypothetical protein
MIKKKSTRNSIRRRASAPKKNSRLIEMAIVAIFALVVIYAASFAIRITHGITKTVDAPEYTIRLQILNGCGVNGAASRVANSLSKRIKLPIEVNVVDIDDFESYHVEESFLISREEDTDPVKILSEQLNLEGNIVFEPIENNFRSITATLVLGDDFEQLLSKPLK